MARIVVIGAGIAGLGVALCAGRQGHQVVLVERDDTPLPADPHGAFDWDRRGAPQVRHSHAFLARLHNLLRDRYPDVLEALYRAGATPMDFIEMLPAGMDRTRLPGDEDLVAIACRRTTFEWVLRHEVLRDPHTTMLHGVGVASLLTDDGASLLTDDGASLLTDDRATSPSAVRVPTISGVELDNGTTVPADVVLVAGGRRADVPELLRPHGVTVPEEVEDTGIIYFSRFFRLRDGASYPPQVGPIGGDLDYLKYGVFQGDNRTFSITLATRTDDGELRRLLLDPDEFLAVAAAIPATASHVEADRSEPITDVNVMAKLLNRRRWFVDHDGAPLVLGLHAVGDAHTCTNPLYGRGCSLAMVQAQIFADVLDRHGLDHDARARAYETATAAEITPWYKASVAQDRMNRSSASADRPGADATPAEQRTAGGDGGGGGGGSDQREFVRQLMRDGLFPALRVDPVVLRSFLRMMNLLEPPDSLMSDAEVIGRVMNVFAQRDDRPPEQPLGPDRASLLGAVA